MWCSTCYPGRRKKDDVVTAPKTDGDKNDHGTNDGTNQINRADGGGMDAGSRISSSADNEKPQAAVTPAASVVAAAGSQTPPPATAAPLAPRAPPLAAERARTARGGGRVEGVPGYGAVLRRVMIDAFNNRWVECSNCNRWLHEVSAVAVFARRLPCYRYI